jgi:hypothetical protein
MNALNPSIHLRTTFTFSREYRGVPPTSLPAGLAAV